MLTAILHGMGVLELLKWIRDKIPSGDLIKGGTFVHSSLSGRFADAARTEFWPWVLDDLQRSDPVARDLFVARQRERHEWQASGGRFNRSSEEYMNEALGRVFTADADPNHRLTLFGEVARMSDPDFEAWLDGVTNDGFERYIGRFTDIVLERVWPQLQALDAPARRALRAVAVAAAVFFAIFVFAEVSGWDLIHGFLAVYLMAAAIVAFWCWPTLVVGLSALKPTRPAMEVVGAAFAAASLLLVLGIFIPLHLVPWQWQMMSLIALLGLSAVAYWGFLKGTSLPIVNPKTVGAVLALVVVVTAVWALNEKYGNVVGDAFAYAQKRAQGAEGVFQSRAYAAEARVPGCDIGATEGMRHTFVAGNNFSALQKIPPHSEFRITADAPVEALFTDGASYILSGDGCEDMGHHALAHFRVRSVSGEPARVSVATRSIK